MPKDWIRIRDSLMKTTRGKRRAFFLLTDVIFIALAVYVSFWLRFDGQIPKEYSRFLLKFIVLSEVCKIISLIALKNYNFTWRYFSVGEGLRLISSLFLGWVSLGLSLYLIGSVFGISAFPRSVFISDFEFSLLLIGSLRVSKRALREYGIRRNHALKGKARTLIIGAGAAGEQIGREMMRNPRSKYFPVAYLDDDPAKEGIAIHGIRVIGKRKDIPVIIKANHIDEILIAMPTAPSKEIREIVTLIRNADSGKKIKILPSIIDLMDGNVVLKDIQEVKVEDLLGREPVKIDYASIRAFISGKRVLITGAGGSIGSELTRTVHQFGPEKLGVLDNDETELYYVTNRLKRMGGSIFPYVADIRDAGKMEFVFAGFRPEIVIHSAAYKHVPILEHFPEEAMKTNVLGTKILGELASKFGVFKFVNISTDKAINPTSIMGTSKRVGEEILKVLNKKNETRFISVRFGNVLGSRGSVIPLFKEQIQRGGPVTVTHPEMKRYFMATSEAVLLVLEAAAAGEGGEVFILDMGEPVKIDDLAREMIRLSGYEPDVNMAIVYTGIRPGEKLFEELIGSEEGSEATEHPKVFKAKTSREWKEGDLWRAVEKLKSACEKSCGREEIIGILKEIVPTYRPDYRNGSILHW
jgi:FlaA1/EpsC-like NDP-sugar epimerase